MWPPVIHLPAFIISTRPHHPHLTSRRKDPAPDRSLVKTSPHSLPVLLVSRVARNRGGHSVEPCVQVLDQSGGARCPTRRRIWLLGIKHSYTFPAVRQPRKAFRLPRLFSNFLLHPPEHTRAMDGAEKSEDNEKESPPLQIDPKWYA